MNKVNWVKFFNLLKVENPSEYYALLSELIKKEKVEVARQSTFSKDTPPLAKGNDMR